MESIKQDRFVVMVVDDEPELRHLVSDVLEDEGYTVISAAHPTIVNKLAGEQTPSLFLLDLMLPGMDGITLARQLRNGPFAQVPMIAFSASPAMLRLADDSMLFQRTLQKPFDLDDLLECVEHSIAESV